MPTRPLQALARDLEAWTGEDVIERARRYLRDGRVAELEARDAVLSGRVEGRRKTPYKIEVDASGPDPRFTCTCPYDDDPLCKHGAAALLAHLRGPEGEAPPEPKARAGRRRRARKESWTIRNVGPDGYLSAFEVRGDSGRSYMVEIRDPGGLVNRCTCPDLRTNLLGTCKHIEAVLEKLRRRAPVKMERLASRPPPFGQLLVRWDGPPRVALRLPSEPSPELERLRKRHFDARGFLMLDARDEGGEVSTARGSSGVAATPSVAAGNDDGRLLAILPDLLEEAGGVDDLRVYGDVFELLDSEREAARRAGTAGQIAAQLRQESLDGQEDLGIRARLYPYQIEGVAFLASRGRALLADDMGLGKTLQALAAFAFLRRQGHASRALVVCPASLKHQWKAEAERFTDLSVEVVEGSPERRKAQYRKRADLTVVNYELVLRDRALLGPEVAADLLILDEAQRIRNWRTKTAEAIKWLRTEFAFMLTGTPLENRLEDLYSLMQVVDPRVLGPLWSFRHRYVAEHAESGRVVGYRNLGQLRQRLAPVMLRRGRAEVLADLPGLVVNRFRLDLTPEQRSIHDEAECGIAILAAIARRRKLTPEEEKRLLTLLNIARMACNAAVLLEKDWWSKQHLPEVMLDEALRWPKLRELRRLLMELCVEEARKVVVFTEWRRMQRLAEAVAEELELGHVSLHGGVPSGRRGELIAHFRDDPACHLFLSTDAGGVGLNLQVADAVVVLDLPWNPAVLAQRVARVHRHGQKSSSVHALMLISRDCLEARIEQLLEEKRSLFDAALGISDLTEMAQPSTSTHMIRVAMEAYGIGAENGGAEPGTAEAGTAEVGTADSQRPGAEGEGAAAEADGGGATTGTEEIAAPGAAPGDGVSPRQREFADRQVEAAEVLAAAGLGGASLVSIYAAVRAEILAALAAEDEEVADEASHDRLVGLLHRRLVPASLSLEEASVLGQARDLATAFGSSTSVPPGLAEMLLERLQALRERLRRS